MPPEVALQARYREAIALHGRGELDRAEALYRAILARMPTSFHALHMLGVLVGQRDDLAQSAQLIERAIAADDRVAAAHANLGHTLRLMERLDDALASYDRALRLQPGNVRALKGRGLILWRSRRLEEALACYEQLLAVEPGYVDGWIMRGAALDALGRRDGAIASYRKALEFDDASDPEKIHYLLAAMGSEPMPAASPVRYVRDLFDKYAQRFDSHLVARLNYRVPELIAAQLGPLLAARAALDVLDLGCGTGLCGPLLRPWARSLAGLDVSPKMIEQARARQVYDELIVEEIAAWLPTQQAAYDLLVAADVFIYFGDLSGLMSSAWAAARAGALFAFSTESHGDAADARLQQSLRYAHSPGYVRAAATGAGWQVVSMSEETLREENRQGVAGHVTVLRKAR